MSAFDLSSDDIRVRSEKLARLVSVSDEDYCNIIPDNMNYEKLNSIYFEIFGVETMDIYMARNILDAKSIMLTDFESSGFFWAQLEEEAQSTEYRELYVILNNEKVNNSLPIATLKNNWCIAKFQNEWFRGYVDKKLTDNKLSIFFIDYGTHEIIDLADTRQLDDDEVWILPPLAIPFVIKDITTTKWNKFKKLQYEFLNIESLKIVEKNCIFEVELKDRNGKPLLELL